MFGKAYLDYQNRMPKWIPLVISKKQNAWKGEQAREKPESNNRIAKMKPSLSLGIYIHLLSLALRSLTASLTKYIMEPTRKQKMQNMYI
jgi:hypothetical protein